MKKNCNFINNQSNVLMTKWECKNIGGVNIQQEESNS